MNLLFYVLLLFTSHDHDIQVAFYKITHDGHHLSIEFHFEKDDLTNSLALSSLHFSEKNLQQYLDQNFSLSVNNLIRKISYQSIHATEKHITLQARLQENLESISAIEIENTCLLNIKEHSNILELRIAQKERDFLMNKDRTNIKVTY